MSLSPSPRLFEFELRDDDAPWLVVRPDQTDPAPVQPRLFGNFLEHLGFSIQSGVSAQLLLNPTLFASPRWPNQNLPAGDVALLREMNTPLAPNRVVFAPQPLPAAGATLTLQLPPRAIGWLRCAID